MLTLAFWSGYRYWNEFAEGYRLAYKSLLQTIGSSVAALAFYGRFYMTQEKKEKRNQKIEEIRKVNRSEKKTPII